MKTHIGKNARFLPKMVVYSNVLIYLKIHEIKWKIKIFVFQMVSSDEVVSYIEFEDVYLAIFAAFLP